MGEVLIVEDYGYGGSEAGIPRDEERVVLARRVWSKIADVARREFNGRLKAAKFRTGRWHSGTNLVERCWDASSACWRGRRNGPARKSCR